jgi:hypothetical protein
MPEFFLGLAAVLIAVVGGTTLAYGDEGGAPSVVWATIMGLSVLFSIRRLRLPKIKEMFFLPTISFTSGLLLLVGSAMLFGRWGAEQWTAWTTLSSSILSFYATYLALYPKVPEFRKGTGGEGEKMRKGLILIATVAVIVFVGIVVWMLLPKPTAPEATILAMKDAINARDADKLYALFSDDLWVMIDKDTLQSSVGRRSMEIGRTCGCALYVGHA